MASPLINHGFIFTAILCSYYPNRVPILFEIKKYFVKIFGAILLK
jgi:hypothetical protein